MLKMNPCIYHIDDLWQMDDKNIRRYLEDNLFVLNHTDDNHTLRKFIIEINNYSVSNDLRVHPVLLCVDIRENPQYSFSQCEQLDPPTAGRQ
jgi:hypothetical protein